MSKWLLSTCPSQFHTSINRVIIPLPINSDPGREFAFKILCEMK